MTVEQDAASGRTTEVFPTINDATGAVLPGVSNTYLAGGTAARAVYPVTVGQTYLVRAGARGGEIGDYQLYLNLLVTAPPGRPVAQAIVLSGAGSAEVSGSIALPGDSVLYSITPQAAGLLAISEQAANGTPLDSFLSVYDASNNLLASNDDGGGGRDSLIKLDVAAGATYYVQAAASGISTGQFHLFLGIDNSGHDVMTASPMTVDPRGSGRVSGSIAWPADQDVFQFVAPADQAAIIRLDAASGSTLDSRLLVYDARDNLIGSSDDSGFIYDSGYSGSSYDSKVLVTLTAGQTYYVLVAGHGSSLGAYDLLVNNGLGNDLIHAMPLMLDSQGLGFQSGWIDQPDQTTTFQWIAPSGGTLTALQLSAPGTDFTGIFAVFDGAGALLGTQTDQVVSGSMCNCGDSDELSAMMAKIQVPVTAGQTYYLQVSGLSSSTGQ